MCFYSVGVCSSIVLISLRTSIRICFSLASTFFVVLHKVHSCVSFCFCFCKNMLFSKTNVFVHSCVFLYKNMFFFTCKMLREAGRPLPAAPRCFFPFSNSLAPRRQARELPRAGPQGQLAGACALADIGWPEGRQYVRRWPRLFFFPAGNLQNRGRGAKAARCFYCFLFCFLKTSLLEG